MLVGERGPSVRLFSELNLKKVVHCRFLEESGDKPQLETKDANNDGRERESHQENEGHQETEGNHENEEPQERHGLEEAAPPVKSSVPLSVSMSHFLKAGVTVASTKKIVELAVEEFNIHTMSWKDPIIGKFLVQKEEYDRGAFRMVNRCKCFGGDFPRGLYVIKSYIPENILPESNESIEAQTRKSVQMHMLARYFAKCFVNDAPPDFGDSFFYSKSYYSTMDGYPVSIELFLDGHFEKLINNNGLKTYSGTNSEYIEKAECFVHYTHQKSQESIMVTDIQGVGYHLTDPEISSKDLRDQNNEWFFGIGNHSLIGIGNFLEEHNCNEYCKAFKL